MTERGCMRCCESGIIKGILNNCKYYDVSEFISSIELAKRCNDSCVVSVFLNIRSIPKNVLEYITDFSETINELDFLCFSETRAQ